MITLNVRSIPVTANSPTIRPANATVSARVAGVYVENAKNNISAPVPVMRTVGVEGKIVEALLDQTVNRYRTAKRQNKQPMTSNGHRAG